MRPAPAPRQHRDAAIQRLASLAPLDAPDLAALEAALDQSRRVAARREIMQEGRPVVETSLIVAGWAARVRILIDGRRQFLSFLLPGDLVGRCHHAHPLAQSTVVALTEVVLARAPVAAPGSGLAEAFAISAAVDEAYLLAQIARLGRLNAQERIGDLLLELHERLAAAGLTSDNGFELPLTQEVLADAVGLTPVHVNRMIQLLRREAGLIWKGRRIGLRDPAALARMVGRSPIRVVAPVATGPQSISRPIG